MYKETMVNQIKSKICRTLSSDLLKALFTRAYLDALEKAFVCFFAFIAFLTILAVWRFIKYKYVFRAVGCFPGPYLAKRFTEVHIN